jgi:hypothetical protein
MQKYLILSLSLFFECIKQTLLFPSHFLCIPSETFIHSRRHDSLCLPLDACFNVISSETCMTALFKITHQLYQLTSLSMHLSNFICLAALGTLIITYYFFLSSQRNWVIWEDKLSLFFATIYPVLKEGQIFTENSTHISYLDEYMCSQNELSPNLVSPRKFQNSFSSLIKTARPISLSTDGKLKTKQPSC